MPEPLIDKIMTALRVADGCGLDLGETADLVMYAIAAHVAACPTAGYECRNDPIAPEVVCIESEATIAACPGKHARLVRAEEVTR